VRLVSPIGSAAGGSVDKLVDKFNVAKLAAHPNLCGFSTPNAMGQSFIITLYLRIHIDMIKTIEGIDALKNKVTVG
jgi:hypothetical protein